MKHLMRRAWAKYAVVAVVTAMVIAPTAAIAGHNFSDVPSTHTFHGDIEWMLDNGITSGCGSAIYCPDSNVTRGQMAAFMKRLATKKVVDAKTALTAGSAITADSATTAATATNATNADKLDGRDSSAFHSYDSDVPGLQSLFGAWGLGETATASSQVTESAISFPVPFNTDLVGHIINVGDPSTTECPGTVADPTALAGNLCIYVGFSTEAGVLDGFYSAVDGFGSVSPYGVTVYLFSDNTGTFEATGTWAATAPLSIIVLPLTEDGAPGSG